MIRIALLFAALIGHPVAAKEQRQPISYANPTALFAAEIAFARAAQERGQWDAFRRFATKDAVMFTPQAVNAQAWLKGRTEPPQAVRWQAHKSVISCDGSLGATTGAAQFPDGSHGMFTTIWQRQKNGSYLWIIDHGTPLASPRVAPEILTTAIAACPPRAAQGAAAGRQRLPQPVLPVIPSPPPAALTDQSFDGSLRWSYAVAADKSRAVTISLRQPDGSMAPVINDVVPGQPAP